MFITGLGTATPPHRYKQSECWIALESAPQFQQLTSRSRAILKKVLTSDNGIATRHLALENLSDAFELNPDALHARFICHAPQLASQAAERALAAAHLQSHDIDAVIVSTCTGYLCPGLTSYVSERLNLRSDALALDLVGQGCGAALPNLRTGEALLSSGRAKHVLSICVEICSAAFFLDDDPGVLISACLFGDGAGAAILSTEHNSGRSIEWLSSYTQLNPANRDLLRFEQQRGMLRNILRPEVPAKAAQLAEKLFHDALSQSKFDRAQLTNWILHPGGRDVLVALREKFNLSENDVRWSAEVLREFGNVSSPSVYFVLQRALENDSQSGVWWMSSFGAGFSCHGALLNVSGSAHSKVAQHQTSTTNHQTVS